MSWLPERLPTRADVDGITFVPLTPALVEPDYAAVMRDVPMLRAWSGEDWPTDDFPIESNLDDLVRHDREHRDRVALTYSLLLDETVQGCIYVWPLASLVRPAFPAHDVLVRGWLHDRGPTDLVTATLAFLGAPPFQFPRIWWQTNSHVPEQLAACDELGLLDELTYPGEDRTWVLRSQPSVPR